MIEEAVDAARRVLATDDAHAKARAACEVAAKSERGELCYTPTAIRIADWPDRPGRPAAPALVAPRLVKRRSIVSEKGRVALLHALAHIELNAIDLAFDIIGRFAHDAAVRSDAMSFARDWMKVGADEARHFLALCERLAFFGAQYGDLPAHDGLWRSAAATSGDLAARLAIAPLVLEARGLDVTPGMIERLSDIGDHVSADTLRMIYADEIGHVACGRHWFCRVCAERHLDPAVTFQLMVATYYPGGVKPPFNTAARGLAGLEAEWYLPTVVTT